MRKTLGVNGCPQVPRYLAPLSGALFSSTWRPTIPTADSDIGQSGFSFGVFCGPRIFCVVSLAKMRVGFLSVIPDASGMIPGPHLIHGILMHISNENLTFMSFSLHCCVFGDGDRRFPVDAFWPPSVRE